MASVRLGWRAWAAWQYCSAWLYFPSLEIAGGEVEVGVVVVALDGDGAEVDVAGLAEQVLVDLGQLGGVGEDLVGDAQVVVRAEEIGVGLAGGLVGAAGHFVVAVMAVDVAHGGEGDRAGGVGLDGLAKLGQGLVVLEVLRGDVMGDGLLGGNLRRGFAAAGEKRQRGHRADSNTARVRHPTHRTSPGWAAQTAFSFRRGDYNVFAAGP